MARGEMVSIDFDITTVNSGVRETIRYIRTILSTIHQDITPIISGQLEQVMIAHLYQAVAAYDQKYPKPPTGNLGAAINVEHMQDYKANMAVSRVIIDENRAPYAMWVNYGRHAPYGLPYSKTGGRDYSTSRFGGHWFVRSSIRAIIPRIPEVLSNVIYMKLQRFSGVTR